MATTAKKMADSFKTNLLKNIEGKDARVHFINGSTVRMIVGEMFTEDGSKSFTGMKRDGTRGTFLVEDVASANVITPPPDKEHVKEMIWSDLRYAQKQIDAWLAKFNDNPAYAFEWSADMFAKAAQIEIGKLTIHYLDVMEEGRTLAYWLGLVSKEFTQEAMRRAKYPEHSTSAMSNEMSLQRNAARVEMVERLNGIIRQIEDFAKD